MDIFYTKGDNVKVNLTKMFGKGKEPTPEEFEAMFPRDYYTYEDVAKKLLGIKTVYWINKFGEINSTDNVGDAYLPNSNNASTKKQLEKLLAINKLLNVAKYLNDGWQPDWYNGSVKYYISERYNEFEIAGCCFTKEDFIYFKSKELAQQAIEILGEETIKLALCTDY